MQQLAVTPGYSLQSEPLLTGDAGTAQTVARIRQLVDDGKKDPFVNRTVAGILRSVAQYDDRAQIRAIYEWVLRNIRFMRDPTGKEVLRPAPTTLQWGYGDCDDINAILLPSMLGTAGFTARIITIASHPAYPESFSHVYAEVFDESRNRWIPIDAARKGTRFGVAPPRQYRARAWSLSEDCYEDLRGLGHYGEGACKCGGSSLGTHARLGRTYRASGLGTHARLGRMYRASGLGFDWSQFADVFSTVEKSTVPIIQSFQRPFGVVYPSAAQYPPGAVVPPGSYPSGYPSPSVVGTISGISPTTWLIGGLALLLLLSRK